MRIAAACFGSVITLLALRSWFSTYKAQADTSVHFVDITKQAGINFVHYTGAYGRKYLPETMGAGCAFIDYDNDGKPDILLIQGSDFPDHRSGQRRTMKLYHNNGNGTFTDVTARAGLAVEMYGMGVAVGDYDNDGWDDIYVTGLGESRLFHNQHGTFKDVTRESGANNAGFGASAVWVDYDRDGKLDLFVTNYVKWSPKTDIYCSLDGHSKSYCTPEAYHGDTCRLFHNLGNGRFEDVTGKAGIEDTTGKSLGVAVTDYDQDGWPDIAVANDTQPNKLYHNNHNGTFTEQAVQAGIAYSEDGIARGGMGITSIDFDGSGYPSLAIGNFSNQMIGLYHNEKNKFFIDIAPSSSVGRASLLSLSFGIFFFDYDLDGLDDLFVTDGHIEPDINRIQPQVSYAEPPLLFHDEGRDARGNVRFEETGKQAGFSKALVGRGAAYADIDNDGAPDILLTTNGGPAYLFHNDGGGRNNAIRIRAVGTRSNRDGIGARVGVQFSGQPLPDDWQTVHSGSSYCSESELTLTFGMGHATAADVTIVWPSGQKDSLKHLAASSTYTIEEGGKILSARPFTR